MEEDAHHYLKIKGSFVYQKKLRPEYRWYNGFADRYLLGDPVNTTGSTPMNAPRGDIRDQDARIWPFETGFKTLQPEDLADVSCVFAEIYPSTIKTTPRTGEILDEIQVKTLSKHLESLDSAGKLADAFGPPNTLSESEIAEITCEEGWILAK